MGRSILTESVLQKKPDLVFLCETLCKQDTVEKVRNLLKFEGAISVDVQGHSGGIALLWRKDKEVKVLSYSKNHVDVEVGIQGWSKFRLTGVYGKPDRAKRTETWDLIRRLNIQQSIPWCLLIGDMNNILCHEDKRGGRRYPNWLIQGFQTVLEKCNLHDVDLVGYRYTWERGKGTDDWMEIKLDRVLVSTNFINTFAEMRASNLEISTSDHSPLFLEPFRINQDKLV